MKEIVIINYRALLYYGIIAIVIIIKIIKWLIKKDWLTKAREKQEIRFKNATPDITHKEPKPIKWTRKEKQNIKKRLSPTGWKFNEETKLWEPPDNLKKK